MFSMPSQNTRRKVRLNEKVESRVRGDLYARFGGECLETYHCKKWQGAGCLAYGSGICRLCGLYQLQASAAKMEGIHT